MSNITLPLFHTVLHDCSMICFCSMFFSDFQTSSCHMDKADAHTTSADVGTRR